MIFRYSVFTCNVLFVLIGLAMLAVGIWAQIEKNSLYRLPARCSCMFQSSESSVEAALGSHVGLYGRRLPDFRRWIQRVCGSAAREDFFSQFLLHRAGSVLIGVEHGSGILLAVEVVIAIYGYLNMDQMYEIVRQPLDDMVCSPLWIRDLLLSDCWLSR